MISNCWFSVNFNSEMASFFKSSRGIRKGDPLAPFLFILASEVLSRGLSTLFQSGALKGYHGPRNLPQISHLLYADDTLIFMNGCKLNMQDLLQFIANYEASAGQKGNASKSSIMVSRKAPLSLKQALHLQSRYKIQSLGFCHLGVPIKKGRYKCADFQYLVDKVVKTLEGWQTKLLSQAGRAILIKSIL